MENLLVKRMVKNAVQKPINNQSDYLNSNPRSIAGIFFTENEGFIK